MRRFLASGFIIALASFTAAAAPLRPGEVVSGAAATRVDDYLQRLVPFGFSGAVLIARDGQVVLKRAYGLADKAANRPYTVDMVSCIGSVTKQFTGAAIVKLQELGKLRVTDPIAKYLPNVPADKQAITIHHLLTHTAGLSPDMGGADEEPITRDALLAKVLAAPLDSKPGEQFAYSNEGYSLAAMIVERVSGQSYETFLREQLWTPAGMNETGYLQPAAPLERRPLGYRENGEPWGRVYKNGWLPDGPGWYLRGNGGVQSTPDDLYKWHLALLTPGKVLSAASLDTYLTGYAPTPSGEKYAYGWGVQKTARNTTLITHNGGNGYLFADFRRYIDEKTVIIAMSNEPVIPAPQLAPRQIDPLFFNASPSVVMPPAVTPVPADAAAAHAGTYTLDGGGTLTIAVKNGAMTAQATDPTLVGSIPGLVPPGGRNAAREQETMTLVAAQAKGDFTPFWAAFKDERPFEVVQGNQTRFWGDWRRQHGEFVRAELLGSAPIQGDIAAVVRLQFERGSEIVQYAWGPRRLLGFVFGAAGAPVPLMSESANVWLSFSYRGNSLVRVSFDGDRVTVSTGALTKTGRRS